MSKIVWMNEYERIEEALTDGEIEEQEARDRLRSLGFDRGEIDDHMDAWKEGMGDGC